MILVKCKCGCIYTLHEDKLGPDSQYGKNYDLEPNSIRKCPECGMSHELTGRSFYPLITDNDYTVYRVPDNAKVTLSFNPDQDADFGFSF